MIYKIILVQKHKDISASTFLGRITCLLTKAVTFWPIQNRRRSTKEGNFSFF